MSYQFDPAALDRQQEPFGDRRQARRLRLLGVAAAVLVMGVFAGGLWLAYLAGTRHAAGGSADEVPLIRADTRPMVVRPAEPGGLKVPDRNMLIYDPGKQMVEHLLPPPEQPMARPTAAAAPAATRAGACRLTGGSGRRGDTGGGSARSAAGQRPAMSGAATGLGAQCRCRASRVGPHPAAEFGPSRCAFGEPGGAPISATRASTIASKPVPSGSLPPIGCAVP